MILVGDKEAEALSLVPIFSELSGGYEIEHVEN